MAESNQSRSTRYLKVYGMAFKHYRKLVLKQKRRCAICGVKTANEHLKANVRCDLFVDHDHATGKVRGLLCQQCNSGLGFFRDNPETLKSAMEYVLRCQNAGYSPFEGIDMPTEYRTKLG